MDSKNELGIIEFDEGTGDSYILSTPDGIRKIIDELSKSLENFESGIESNYPIDLEWIDESDVVIHYIKIENEIKTHDQIEETLIDKLLPIGCIGLILLGVLSSIVGLITIIKWIF